MAKVEVKAPGQADREFKVFMAWINGMRAEEIAKKLTLPLTYVLRVLSTQLCTDQPFGIGRTVVSSSTQGEGGVTGSGRVKG